MPTTYGSLRYSLDKQIPGIAREIWDSWIVGIYQEIIDQLPWQRLKSSFTLQTAAEVNTGTVTISVGNAAVIGSGTAWNTFMSGRIIRFAGGPEYYQVTITDAVTAQLDRPYEGPNAGTGVTYQINQTVYPLPSTVAYVEQVSDLDDGWALGKMTLSELNASDAQRSAYGSPGKWVPLFDEYSTPPVPQIEIYPVPDKPYGLRLDVVSEDVTFGTGSATTALPWIRPLCIQAGARSLAEAHLKDFNAAAFWEAKYRRLAQQLVNTDSALSGPQRIQMSDRFTRHRLLRSTNYLPHGPRLP